ncbi:hypothetical protein MLD52_07355 [Puniceicoccaceae bacterium K14]|nr:hypothetical protein [Puniceicoccaceae bacterium K14]
MTSGISIVSRSLCALLGGYVFSNAVALVIVFALNGNRALNTSAGLMFVYAFYAVAVIFSFATHSAWRAWAWVAGSSALFFGIAYFLSKWGGA